MNTARRKPYSRTTYMALCGLFAALTAVCSYISLPLGFTPVPVNLATLAVFLAGGLLGKKYGAVALTVYALLGAVGVPVFSGFRGGLSVLAGPTGGYIIGYIAAAFLTGLVIERLLPRRMQEALRKADGAGKDALYKDDGAGENAPYRADGAGEHAPADPVPAQNQPSHIRELMTCIIAMITGLAACYFLGTLWFMVSTHTGVWAALVSCVFPFLPGDALKIAAGGLLVSRLRHLL